MGNGRETIRTRAHTDKKRKNIKRADLDQEQHTDKKRKNMKRTDLDQEQYTDKS